MNHTSRKQRSIPGSLVTLNKLLLFHLLVYHHLTVTICIRVICVYLCVICFINDFLILRTSVENTVSFLMVYLNLCMLW